MKIKKRKSPYALLFLAVIIITAGLLVNDVIGLTYATTNQAKSPDVTVTINSGGSMRQSGSLFGSGPGWYPGHSEDGVLQIKNNFGRSIKVTGFKLEVSGVSEHAKESFLKNMKLSIEKGKLIFGTTNIVPETTFKDFVDNGYILKTSDQFNIGNNDSLYLKYTMKMDINATDELENLSANVKFKICMNENPQTDDDRPKKVKEVMSKHWAHDCIIALLDNEVIQGYPNDTMTIEDYRNDTIEPEVYVKEAVNPEGNITRAETAELIDNALAKYLTNYGEVEDDNLSKYYVDHKDIKNWAKPHVMKVTVNDIMEGYPGTFNKEEYYFKPNKEISRQEMTAVLVRAFELKLENEGFKLTFEDKEEIAKWAEEYVKAGVENNVIEGYPNNTFQPKDTITRAEAFTIICKLLGLHEEH